MALLQRLSLYRRSNGVYYLRYEEHGLTRYKSTGSKNRRDALKSIAEFRTLIRESPPSKALSAFIPEYLSFVQSKVTAATAEGYSSALKRFLSIVGDIPVRSMTTRHIDAFVIARQPKKSASTVNIDLRAIRAALNVAMRWKYLTEMPAFRLLRTEHRIPAYFDMAGFQKLLGLVEEGWLRDLMVFSVATGLRRGEVLSLKWEDVDLPKRLVTIRHTKSKQDRVIPLNDIALALLKGKVGRSNCRLIFHRRGYPIGKSYLTHIFKRYVRDVHLDIRLHWHSLRHTHASWLVASGASLYAVQKLLGHSSPTVTQIYAHLQPEQLHSTVNRIKIALN